MPEKVRKSLFPPELDSYEDKLEKLGEGGFAEVHLAEHRRTGMKVAIKVMNKKILEDMGDLHRAYREIDAMKRLGFHQHICHLYQVTETAENIYLVLEYIPGGELFDYIVSKEKLTEKQARSFFRQILSAVAYMHSKDVAHRDLKPENMLLDSCHSIKIIDFGLSSNPDNNLMQPLATCCGSPAYAAPELVSGKSYYGSEADLWSLGVVLYGLLNGFLPFDVEEGESTYKLYDKIKRGVFDIPEWLSSGSIMILSKLLETNPAKRITTDELLSHPWVCEGYGSEIKWESIYKMDNPDPKIIEELCDYYNKPSHETLANQVKEFKYDDLTAHYVLLSKLRQKVPRPKVCFKTPVRESSKSRMMNGKCAATRHCQSVSIDDIDVTPTRRDRSKSCAVNDDDIFADPCEKDCISPLRDTREKAASHVDNLSKLMSLTPAPRKPLLSSNLKFNLAVGTVTPKFAKRIGRRVVNLMTPKKSSGMEEPRKIKGVYQVSTTSTKSAKAVSLEIECALSKLRESERIYSYEATRYRFKCKSRDEKGSKLTFLLEICAVPGFDAVVGIRHSRLRGSSWSYKKICDTILGMIKI